MIGHILCSFIFCFACLCNRGTKGSDHFRGKDVIRETIRLNWLNNGSISDEGSNVRRLRRCHHRGVSLRVCLPCSASLESSLSTADSCLRTCYVSHEVPGKCDDWQWAIEVMCLRGWCVENGIRTNNHYPLGWSHRLKLLYGSKGPETDLADRRTPEEAFRLIIQAVLAPGKNMHERYRKTPLSVQLCRLNQMLTTLNVLVSQHTLIGKI